MNIVVLAGGWSPEREVSLTSGSLIANALMRNGHGVLLLDAYLGMPLEGNPLSLFRHAGDPEYHYRVGTRVPDLEALRKESGNGQALIGQNVLTICHAADVVYNAMHGDMGENGTLQGFLDCEGICYTGTGAIGALLSMDKDLSKRLLRDAGIATPDWILVRPDRESDVCDRVAGEIGFPCVIKPCSCGSSVGVSMVEDATALTEALTLGARYEETLLVEKKIVGRELTVGYLDGEALPPIEIIPKEGFYDYRNKYQNGCTLELCPAPLSEQATQKVQSLTLRGVKALRLEGYARFDYIMDAEGTMWCLEANALPGMTPTSLLPQMAAARGMSYEALCECIVRMATEKKKR